MQQDNPIRLEIENLSKTYNNGVTALNNVNLTINRGIFGLLGPNGAGKSSLMRTLATLQEADAGAVKLGQLNVLDDPAAVRATLGYLPQEFGVYPNVTARKLLDQIAVFKGIGGPSVRHKIVDQQLELVNLSAHRDQALGTFSGGMRQRFGIAQALLGDPALVIVDEPTAGLDPAERVRFHNLLATVAENRVLMMSTHIVEDVSDLCTDMAIMLAGKIVLRGAPAEQIAKLNGRVWTCDNDNDNDIDLGEDQSLITARMVRGTRRVRVLADMAPGANYESADADLNDVYFCALNGLIERLN
ncbi:MAG: ABC transporter ATP-binding protein [Pseudomonadota bacterium]